MCRGHHGGGLALAVLALDSVPSGCWLRGCRLHGILCQIGSSAELEARPISRVSISGRHSRGGRRSCSRTKPGQRRSVADCDAVQPFHGIVFSSTGACTQGANGQRNIGRRPESPGIGTFSTGPLIVSAHHVVANSCAGAPGWRVPFTPEKLGTAPLDDYESTVKWAEQHDGIEVSGTRIELTLQGATKSAIVIKDINVNVVRKVRPSTGTHVIPYGECGGNNDTRYLVAKLDNIPTQVYEGREDVNTGVVRKKSNRSFSSRIFHVSKSDPEKFVLVAYGSKLDYSWQPVIRWLSPEGDEYITTVNNEKGEPFSTVVQSSRTAYVSVPVGDGTATWQKTTRHYAG